MLALRLPIHEFSVADTGADVLTEEERGPDIAAPEMDFSAFAVADQQEEPMTESPFPKPAEEPAAKPANATQIDIPDGEITMEPMEGESAPKAAKAKGKASFIIDDDEELPDNTQETVQAKPPPKKPKPGGPLQLDL